MVYDIIKEKHTNEENALIVDNYPYGFTLRTKIKYWVETTKRGDRFVSQTLNPKTNKWNKPKLSTYKAVMVLIKKKENEHISYIGLYPTTDKEEITKFLEITKDYDLSEPQKEQLRILQAYSKVYENVTFKCRVKEFRHKVTGEIKTELSVFELNQYEEVTNEEHEQQQEKVKEDIKKGVAMEYSKLKRGVA